MSTLLSRFQWKPEHLQRLAFPLTALLVVMVAYGSARLTWDIMPAPEPSTSAPPPRDGAGSGDVAGGGESLESIARWQLFGEADSRDDDDGRIDAPETNLALELKGVFYSPKAGRASALISSRRDGTRQYREGDSLAGGSIEAIYENRVVLRRQGAFETLSLEAARIPLDRTVDDLDTSLADGKASGTPTADQGQGDGSGESDELEHYRQQLADDPRQLSQMVGLQPATEDGEMVGVRVSPGEDERVMELLGLEPDDVVTSIGGTALDSPSRAFEAVQGLEGGEPVELGVRRDGDEQTLQIDFN
ncbi:type II secretion system protein N [Aquisalimonas sp.]|uniref:type II secretion system protein N n=1 Tax=unclassified Aquisalimonas TaxID=2644645 RepID=UPI0025C3CBEA|nr:type II secretion system protein N [Aquisalimonas sp.]